jgi:cytochrome P450 family 6
MIFRTAGQDSSSATIAYTFLELTRNADIMNRLMDDINSALERNNGKVSYESIMDMKYLDMCVKETLRKYPLLAMLNRECTKDYQIPGTNVTIEKGTAVVISVLGLHRDENVYPNPELYDPERFMNAHNVEVFYPFGAGPRNCLGDFGILGIFII